MNLHQSPLFQKAFIALWLSVLATAIVTFAIHGQFDEEENLSSGHEMGLGLQQGGSACCISVRSWTEDARGVEVNLFAERLLFLSVRGFSKFADTEVVDGYAGAGVGFVFSALQVTTEFPIRSVQLFVGLEFTLPFIPQFALNVEGILEFDRNREFYTAVGSGIHYYF